MHPIARPPWSEVSVVVLPGGPDVAVVSSDDVVLESSRGGDATSSRSVEPLAADVELRSARGLRHAAAALDAYRG